MPHRNPTKISKQKRLVEAAARSKNPLERILDTVEYKPTMHSDDETSNRYEFYCRSKNDMHPKILKWAFKLAERNVGGFYKQLSMGWLPKIKQGDLNKSWARYLVAINQEKVPVGYAMFRFDMDYSRSVLYCYELQIEPIAQNQGLGKYMMHVLVECARFWQLEKVILTVLKNNEKARQFFRTIGFTLDPTTPDVAEDVEYEILSIIIS